MMQTQVVVIGGGAAGMMAALSARQAGASVTLLEPNEKLGRKLYITGKGRCNLTNNTTPEGVLNNVPRNGRFLYSAVTKFPPGAVMEYFEKLGVPLKTERGGRVFPCSDKAADVIDALFFALKKEKVTIRRARAMGLEMTDGRVTGVKLEDGVLPAGAVILATGGVSYPGTGSTGDGYRFAREAGHKIVEPRASLVPLVEDGDTCARMQGLSLKNVTLTVKNQKKKVIFQEQGEMLFTHFGLSGPLVLSASAHGDWSKDRYTAIIDLKPALDEAKLEARILRDVSEAPNKAFHNFLEGLAPRLMIPVLCEKADIPPDMPVNTMTKGQRRRLMETMKHFTIPIAGTRPVKEAIITAGGVKTGEIDPGTMMSKKTRGLFLAGEVIDVDAYTGGFNLQIAWCTGRAAGESAARYAEEERA
ncbi:NAD(P)/FAD-dependent oxidoreductase [Evtepia sp.]|uniref:NAD(P)/FAD-dependent oxidoreductase n=1 Tax=Evtepia sp. TaxID=2773933 RepID=UPI003F1867BC